MSNNLDIYTNKQRRFIAALVKYRNFDEVATVLGCSRRQVYRYAQNVKKRISKDARRNDILS